MWTGLDASQSRQTVNYHESRGTRNQECAGEGQQQFIRLAVSQAYVRAVPRPLQIAEEDIGCFYLSTVLQPLRTLAAFSVS
jgi:hypothetical protein